MYIYLVINTEGDPFIIDICRTVGAANYLADKYRKNFEKYHEYCDFIEVEKVSLNSMDDVFWTAYNSSEDKDPALSYSE